MVHVVIRPGGFSLSPTHPPRAVAPGDRKLLGHGPQPTTTTKITTTSIPVVGSFDITNAGQLNSIAASQQALGANAVVAKQTNVAGIAANAGGQAALAAGSRVPACRGQMEATVASGFAHDGFVHASTRSVWRQHPYATTCTPGASLNAAAGATTSVVPHTF